MRRGSAPMRTSAASTPSADVPDTSPIQSAAMTRSPRGRSCALLAAGPDDRGHDQSALILSAHPLREELALAASELDERDTHSRRTSGQALIAADPANLDLGIDRALVATRMDLDLEPRSGVARCRGLHEQAARRQVRRVTQIARATRGIP